MRDFLCIFAVLFLLCFGYVYCVNPSAMSRATTAIAMPQPVQPSAPSPCTGCSYRQMARQDAINHGIDPTLFERQIDEESGFNPNAVSQAHAIGIAQIIPSTASSWDVNPWDPVASLNVAADHMAWYQHHYGSYAKGLACYNAGCPALESAMARCGGSWRACLPLETQNYIRVITGG